jgi:hypothetical protein
MALIILGAGATRGASFVNEARQCHPPLDADFFTQLQKVADAKHQRLIDEVLKDVVELFGVNFKATLETTFTTLEHTRDIVMRTGDNRSFSKTELTKKRDRLLQALAAVFEESLCERRQMLQCEYHDKLVQNLLQGDTILSFNYDCTIDDSLRRLGDGKWNARYGYCVPLRGVGSLTGDEEWSPENPAEKKRTVHLIKLHGSMHFDESESSDGHVRMKIKQRPYTKQRGNLHFSIVPPEWNKTAYRNENSAIPHLWKRAAKELQRATTVVVIGYSIPASDMLASALFRVGVKLEALSSLVVVNPDQAARMRAREVFKRGLHAGSRVLSFNSFKCFTEAPRELWDRPIPFRARPVGAVVRQELSQAAQEQIDAVAEEPAIGQPAELGAANEGS